VPSKSFIQRYEDRAREGIDALEALLKPAEVHGRGTLLADLLYRAELTSRPDGYSRGGSGEKVGGGGEATDSTLSTALARMEDVCTRCVGGQYSLSDGRRVPCRACRGTGRRWADPIGDAVGEILERLSEIARAARIIDMRRSTVLGAAESARGRVSSLQGNCVVCGQPVTGVGQDQLHRGLDVSCYLKWDRWKLTHASSGDPGADRRRFARWVAEQIKAEQAKR